METKPLVLLVGGYDSKVGADTHDEAGTGCGTLATVLWPRPPGPVGLQAGASHDFVTATVDRARIGGTAIEIDLTTPVARWTSDGADRGDHPAEGPTPPRRYPRTPRTAVTDRAAQAALMVTGSWTQVSIDALDGVDNLIPLSVTG